MAESRSAAQPIATLLDKTQQRRLAAFDDLVAALRWAQEALDQTGDLGWEPLHGPELSVGALIAAALEKVTP